MIRTCLATSAGLSAGLFGGLFSLACDGTPTPGGPGGDGSGANGNGSGGAEDGGFGGAGGTGGGAMSERRLAGTDAYDCSAATGAAIPKLQLTEITSDLSGPVLLTHAPNDDRLFIVEQSGTVRTWQDGTLTEEPFLDLSDKVLAPPIGGNEQGLLGLAFHPNYQQNGVLYVHYSAASANTTYEDGDTVIEEYRVGEDGLVDESTVRPVLDENQPNANHNGGSIVFGPDGMLYIGLGDGGGAFDPDEHGQDPATLLGAMLRIDPTADGSAPYSIPEGNLSEVRPEAAPEVWDYGLRNPYRFNFDPCLGDLYIADVGQNEWEEINVEPFASGQRNYGWPIMEGNSCVQQGCDQSGLTLPPVDYSHEPFGDQASVTGGAVYRSSAIPALRGHYFYADFVSGVIWSFHLDGSGQATEPVDRTADVNPTNLTGWTAIQNGPSGGLYFLNRSGTLYELEEE